MLPRLNRLVYSIVVNHYLSAIILTALFYRKVSESYQQPKSLLLGIPIRIYFIVNSAVSFKTLLRI